MNNVLTLKINKKDAITFAFRCQWVTETGDSDGFTYSLTKPILKEEILRRERVSKSKVVGGIKLIKIEMFLWKSINLSRDKFYSTTLEVHDLDLESKNFKKSELTERLYG